MIFAGTFCYYKFHKNLKTLTDYLWNKREKSKKATKDFYLEHNLPYGKSHDFRIFEIIKIISGKLLSYRSLFLSQKTQIKKRKNLRFWHENSFVAHCIE